MNKEQMWDWDARMFISASYLYYKRDISIWKDELFDHHCGWLIQHYDKLPEWFKERVSIDDLKTGSGYFLDYTEDDVIQAEEWLTRAKLEGWYNELQ